MLTRRHLGEEPRRARWPWLALAWLCLGVVCPLAPAQAGSEASPALGLSLKTGFQYDSGVAISDADLVARQSDIAAVVGASLDWKLIDTKSNTLVAGYDLGTTTYDATTQYNTLANTARLGWNGALGQAGTPAGAVRGGLGYQFTNIRLGGRDFLSLHGVNTSLSGFVMPDTFLFVSHGFQARSFAQSPGLDAHRNQGMADVFFYVDGRRAYGSLGVRVEREDAADPVYGFTAWQLAARLQVPLPLGPEGSRLKAGFEHYHRDYLARSPYLGDTRFEHRNTVYLSADVPLASTLKARPDYRFIARTSNDPARDYDEHVAGLFFVYGFGL